MSFERVEIGPHVLYCGDCLQVLPTLAAGSVDAVVTDPPWGIALNTDNSRYPGGLKYSLIVGDDKQFDFAPFRTITAKEQFWFGAENYLNLPPAGSWLCWDKYPTDKSDGRISGHFELIWSKARHKRTMIRQKAINTSWVTVKEACGHPTQKPVALIEVILRKFVDDDSIVLDPFMGSGTTGVACVKTGRTFIGIEISKEYFDIARKRIEKAMEDTAMPLLEGVA